MLRSLLLILLLAVPNLSTASAKAEQHGLSLFGDLKYPAPFKKFSYANARAPKKGKLTIGAQGGFDSLNPFIIKGRPAQYLTLIYDTLMAPSLDEPASAYGLIARSVEIAQSPKGQIHVTFTLRRTAHFHDGRPITADDVIWTFKTLKASHPFYSAYYRDVLRAEKLSSHQVRFHLDWQQKDLDFTAYPSNEVYYHNVQYTKKLSRHQVRLRVVRGANRELPFILGQLPVLPKHFWQQKNRDFMKTSLTPPLGSGPYRIAKVDAGRAITYERVKNYWGKNLPVNVGHHNIGEIRVDYFGDDSVMFEAFKSGDLGFRIESRAANWALGYRAIKAKHGAKLVREDIEDKNPSGMQAWTFNIRREKFSDPRLRAAFNYAFDFEWMNKNFFHRSYRRTGSYFEGSELASTAADGLPSEDELKLLSKWRGKIPDEVFTQAFVNPKTDGSGRNRAQRREALRLLREAGWQIKDEKLINIKTGQPLFVEILLVQPLFEKIALAYKTQLKKLGIDVRVQLVDPAQYRNRLRDYDFDIIINTFGQSLSPGNEQRDFWSAKAAQLPGGRNLIGVQSPAVDALIENIIAAKNRRELIAASRALDRVLLAGHYVVPQWHLAATRLAFWRPLAHPNKLPDYGLGFPAIWWLEE